MQERVTDPGNVQKALEVNRAELFRFGLALIFVIGIMIFTASLGGQGPHATLLTAAAMIGGYMALNIGANDVANNVGPAVGSRAITMAEAIAIAAVCEAAGALIRSMMLP